MRNKTIIASFLFLIICGKAFSQANTENSTQEDFVNRMLAEVGRIVDKANIQVTGSTITESDLSKTLSGSCNFFSMVNVGYMAKFDASGLVRRFEISVPLGQKLNPDNISAILKSGNWAQLFIPDDVKNSMVLSKYFINFTNTLTIDSVGVDFSIPTQLPIFGLSALRLADVGIGYRVSNPLTNPSLQGVMSASVLWGGTNNPVNTFIQSNLVRNPKDWELTFGIGNLSINSVAENLGIDKSLIPQGVNNLLTLTSAYLTVKPSEYSFLFNGISPLGNINLLVKRVTLDDKPVTQDTLSLNTSLTGTYSTAAKPPPLPPGHPDAPPPPPPASVPKNYKWGFMAGFSLPESNEEVKAISYMRKIGLTNIALVVSTFEDAVETSLPIFANAGSGNTLIQKGISFVAWIPVDELLTKYKLTQPLRTFAPAFMEGLGKANPIRSVMFRANVPVTTVGEFNLEADLNFNERMAISVKGKEIAKLSNFRLELKVSPVAQTAEVSVSAYWSLLLDPTRSKPLDFFANMFVKPGVDGSITLGVTGAMLSSWENIYGLPGISFNSLKFKCGLSFSTATSYIPIPDDLFLTGQMKYGAVVGDVTMAINYNQLTENMVLARVCQLSLANVIDQFLSGTVKTKYASKKSAYVNVLSDFLNMELKDVYFKAIPPNAPTSLMSGLRLEADYTKDCNTSLKLGDSWVPGIRMAAEGKFAGWNGLFDIGVEGSLSSLSGGMTIKGKMDPIKISANGFKVFHLSGLKETDPFELYVDLSTNNLLNGVSTLLSGADAASLGAGRDKFFLLSGGLTILEAASARTLIELTPSGYKFRANGKIYKLVSGTIDATIGSFRDILNTTTVSGQLNTGEIQQQVTEKLSAVIGDIPFFNELRKGFSLKSISFDGKLAMLQTAATAKMEFKIAGKTFTPAVTISMGNSIDFLVNTIVSRIKETANDAIAAAKKIFNDAIEIARLAVETLKNTANEATRFAVNTAQAAIRSAAELKTKLTNVAQTSYATVRDGIESVGKKVGDFFIDFGKFSIQTVEKIYNKAIKEIKNGWESFTKAMKTAFTGADNEERIMTDGPAFRVITRYQGYVLSSPGVVSKNYPIQVRPKGASTVLQESWQLVPNDKSEEGSFFLVSGYNALLVTVPWTTHNILIPHESDHKDRERMLMESVPNEPGWYYLKFRNVNKDNTNYYIEVKSVSLPDIKGKPGFTVNTPQWVLAPVPYLPGRKPGEMGKFKFEKTGDIDWLKAKNLPPPMTPATPLTEGNRYSFNGQPEQYIFSNGSFRWIPDLETLTGGRYDQKPLVILPNNQQVSTVIGTAIPSRKDGIVLQATGDPAVYIMEGGKRRWIPDINTFNLMGLKPNMIQNVSSADLNTIPAGDQIPVNFNPRLVVQEKALYQVPGDPTVYVVLNKTFRAIPDPETLAYMGYNFGQIQSVTATEFSTLTKGTGLATRRQNAMVQENGKPEVYMMDNGIRRLIPDPETLSGLGLNWNNIQKITAADMSLIPLGPAMISMK